MSLTTSFPRQYIGVTDIGRKSVQASGFETRATGVILLHFHLLGITLLYSGAYLERGD